MTENEAIIRFDFIRCALLGGTKPHIMPNEGNIGLVNAAIQALEEVQQYRAIGTPEECKIAVEKQRPKKPINPDDDYGTFKCPNCNGLIFTEDRFETHRYCLLCGQKLDWSDE